MSLYTGSGSHCPSISKGLTIIGDFRTADIAVGGQGAPLTSTFDVMVMAALDKPIAEGRMESSKAKGEGQEKGLRAVQNIGGRIFLLEA